jgi:hypothetical protein
VSKTVTYVEIPNWPSLQHYRSRRAAWVKLNVSLLRDERYLALGAHERAVLHGIWLVYAQTSGRVVARPSWLSRQLGFRVFRKTLDVLATAGFVEFRPANSHPASMIEARSRSANGQRCRHMRDS